MLTKKTKGHDMIEKKWSGIDQKKSKWYDTKNKNINHIILIAK